MDPAMSFWLTMQDDAQFLEEAFSEMKLHELDIMLCPINDTHMTCTADAGSHWSLLVCWGNTRSTKARQAGPFSKFRYYDSLGGLFAEKGFSQAQTLANRLVGETVQIEMGSCSQQTNFYDCGVYVLLFSEIIATSFLEALRRENRGSAISAHVWEDRLLSVTPEEVDACRAHYRSIAGDKCNH
jgi:Ulp1 family protease